MSKPINEQSLLEFTRCPLREAAVDESSRPCVIEHVAEDLVRFATLQAYEGSVPSLPAMRERAEMLYKTVAGSPDLVHSRNLIRLCRRIHDLLTVHDVLHPQSPYRLELGHASIDGDAAMLRVRSRGSVAKVLRLRPRGSPAVFAPDVVSLSRWLYTTRESGYPACVVYNYWILNDIAIKENFSESVAQNWLSSATTAYTQHRIFPSPGAHCKGCSRPCEDFKQCKTTL